MAGHDEARPLLNTIAGLLEKAFRERRHLPARVAPNVIVVPTGQLVSDPAITQRDRRDHATLLEPTNGAKHRGVVGGHPGPEKPRVQVFYRPVVPFVAFKQLANRVAHVAWPCHGVQISNYARSLHYPS